MLELLYKREPTAHARASSSNVICDYGSQKGMKKFASSKRINFKEYRPLRRGMAMGGTRGMCSMSSSIVLVKTYYYGTFKNFVKKMLINVYGVSLNYIKMVSRSVSWLIVK